MRMSSERNQAALILVFFLVGCKAKPLRVDIAPGYSGPVIVVCGSWSDDFQAITVNSTGTASNAICPSRRTELLIMQDGKRVYGDGPEVWEATGDGIPMSIRFTIR